MQGWGAAAAHLGGSQQGAIKGQPSGLVPGQNPCQIVNECHHDSDSQPW